MTAEANTKNAPSKLNTMRSFLNKALKKPDRTIFLIDLASKQLNEFKGEL